MLTLLERAPEHAPIRSTSLETIENPHPAAMARVREFRDICSEIPPFSTWHGSCSLLSTV
jgi:hypothetical protein